MARLAVRQRPKEKIPRLTYRGISIINRIAVILTGLFTSAVLRSLRFSVSHRSFEFPGIFGIVDFRDRCHADGTVRCGLIRPHHGIALPARRIRDSITAEIIYANLNVSLYRRIVGRVRRGVHRTRAVRIKNWCDVRGLDPPVVEIHRRRRRIGTVFTTQHLMTRPCTVEVRHRANVGSGVGNGSGRRSDLHRCEHQSEQ